MSSREARTNWTIQKGDNGHYSYDQAHLAVLMDLRDLLDRLVAVLECSNFTRLPVTLRAIERNTRKKKRVTKVPAHR